MRSERTDRRSMLALLFALISGLPVAFGASAVGQVPSSEPTSAEDRIDLALRDAALRDVLGPLASMGSIAFEYSPEARARLDRPVTVAFEDVTWDFALDEVLRLHGLTVERGEDGVFRVDLRSPESSAVGLALAGTRQRERLDLALDHAPLLEVLESFAALTGSRLEFDPTLTGTVSLQVERVDWTTALDAVCQSTQCRWRLVESRERVLKVEPGEALHPDDRVQLQLDEAPAQQVVEVLLDLQGLGLSMGGSLETTVSLDLDGVAWYTALDAVCQAAGCRWQRLEDPARIEVVAVTEPVDDSASAVAPLDQRISLDLVAASAHDVLSAMAHILEAELESPEPLSGEVTTTWSDAPVRAMLDEVCGQLALEWRYETRDGGRRLVVFEP